MSTAKVIEILAQSEKGWEDAAQKAVDEVSKTVKNVEHIYIKDMQAVVENNKITRYRINAKVTFVVKH